MRDTSSHERACMHGARKNAPVETLNFPSTLVISETMYYDTSSLNVSLCWFICARTSCFERSTRCSPNMSSHSPSRSRLLLLTRQFSIHIDIVSGPHMYRMHTTKWSNSFEYFLCELAFKSQLVMYPLVVWLTYL